MKKVKEFLEEKKEAVRWKELLALMGFTESEIEEFYIKLEEMREFIVSLSISLDSIKYDGLVMPIITRAYKKYKYIFRSCKEVYAHIVRNYYRLDELKQATGLDAESAFIDLMATEIKLLKL